MSKYKYLTATSSHHIYVKKYKIKTGGTSDFLITKYTNIICGVTNLNTCMTISGHGLKSWVALERELGMVVLASKV